MTRLFGAVIIFFVCSTVGFSASKMYSRRVKELEAFASLISYIGAQIDGFLTPLDRIYATAKSDTLEGFLKILRQSGGTEAVRLCSKSLHLAHGEYAELEHFFEGLGHHSADEEAKHCAYFEKRIRGYAENARKELPAKGRVCRTVGMLLGVMLALVLL